MPRPARQLTADEVKTLASAHIRISEYDLLIDRELQAYSNWFVAAAVAGFSVAITQADHDFVAASALGKGLFVASLALSLLSILSGVFVRHLGNKDHSYERQKMTLAEIQYLNLHLSPPNAPDKDVRRLTERVLEGHYLEDQQLKKMEEIKEKLDRVSTLRKRVSIAQQALVGAAYLAIGAMSVLPTV